MSGERRSIRRPHQPDLEMIVGHFLYYLSNEPDPKSKTGISPRQRLYGMLPIQSKLLFPDVPDEVITNAVAAVIRETEAQSDLLGGSAGSWRTVS